MTVSDISGKQLAMSIATTNLTVPINPAERRGWIIWQLRLRGYSLRRIADEEGKFPQSVSYALGNPSADMEFAIARRLDMTPQQLWPERFDASGRRLHVVRGSNRTATGVLSKVEKAEAA